MTFLKEHLVADHYSWVNNNTTEHAYIGQPGRRPFDRFNGNQVLYIINCFGESVGRLTIDDGQKLENFIIKQLPEKIKSELAVFNWLKGIYLYYWN